MQSLDVVRMIVASCRSHSSWLDVVGDDLAAVGKGFVADCALSALLGDLPIEQLPHLRRRPKFAVSPGMRWIFDPLHTEP
jgi:hypothetical protein